MTLHDFFQERITPFFKGDYQNFSSKAVDGYSLFIAQWDKSPRQAMITFDTQAQLQRVFEKYSAFTDSKEGDLQSSQISRWYVNGFTLAYNYCRRYDLDHLYEHTDFVQLAEKLKSSDNVNRGEWNFDMFRKYTINFGRHEGTLFYVAEKESCSGQMANGQDGQSKDNTNNFSPIVFKVENDYHFPDDLMEELYESFNGKIFKNITTPEEFKSIITRRSHIDYLSECSQKRMLMYKILHDLSLLLPENIRVDWLKDIAYECNYKVENINKKHNGSDSVTEEYRKKMGQINHIFSKYSRS